MLQSIFPLLMCPYCGENKGNIELELHIFSSSELLIGTRIHEGIIFCRGCRRFYVINDEILYMSIDRLREKEQELQFLIKWQQRLPEYILKGAKPYNLAINNNSE